MRQIFNKILIFKSPENIDCPFNSIYLVFAAFSMLFAGTIIGLIFGTTIGTYIIHIGCIVGIFSSIIILLGK